MNMFLKETTIMECWCPHCQYGQVQKILQRSFEEKKVASEYIGKIFVCPRCKKRNILKDVIKVIPQEFLIFSDSDLSNIRKERGIAQFLNTEQKGGV